MAKKPASGRSRKAAKPAAAKVAARPKAAAKAKAPAKATKGGKATKAAKPAKPAKPATPPKQATGAKVAAKPAARPAAKQKGAALVGGRQIVARQQPETLRCMSISVGLTVDDLAASMRFYVDGLGFFVKNRWERDGKLVGVEMLAGACMLAIGQDDWAKGRDRGKGEGMRIYLETSQSIDVVAARIRSRGVAADGPHDAPWGARLVHVTDPDGFAVTLYQERENQG